jgi:hypothetical protein
MPRFRADVSLFFDAPSLDEAGPHLRALTQAVEKVGFDLWMGEVSDDVANDPQSSSGPTAYGPPA